MVANFVEYKILPADNVAMAGIMVMAGIVVVASNTTVAMAHNVVGTMAMVRDREGLHLYVFHLLHFVAEFSFWAFLAYPH